MPVQRFIPGLIVLSACLASFSTPPLSNSFQTNPESDFQRELRARGNALFQSGKYLDAIGVYDQGYRQALAEGRARSAVRFLNNLAGARYAVFDYRGSLKDYLDAKRLAQASGYAEMLPTLQLNIAALYAGMRDRQAASQGLAATVKAAMQGPRAHRDQTLMQLGWLYYEIGDNERAAQCYRLGLHFAAESGNAALEAKGLDHLGGVYLRSGDLESAERYLTAAFRLRRLSQPSDLHLSYQKLGSLRLAQGDALSAATLYDRAVEMSGSVSSLLPLWTVYYERAQALRKLGRTREALEDLSSALDYARRWRGGVLPADSVRVGAGAGLAELYAAYIETASEEWLAGGDRKLLSNAFAAGEESRAAALRALLGNEGSPARKLPQAYGEKLSNLRMAEVALARDGSESARRRVTELRMALTDMEAQAGLQMIGAADATTVTLAAVQSRLGADEALLAFASGDTNLYLWAVTREAARLIRIGSLKDLEPQFDRFANAVTKRSNTDNGATVYHSLFGGLEPQFLNKTEWLVLLDGALFDVPLGALRTANGGRYLVEEHTIRSLPGAWSLGMDGSEQTSGSPLFLGLSDAVYNVADPRWSKRPGRRSMEMSRLPGTSAEVATARQESGAAEAVLLSGFEMSRGRVMESLERNPALVHFAGHVVKNPAREHEALLHLGLGADGQPLLIGPADIATLSLNVPLVVLSGCASGTGEKVRGEGVVGLTRAWLGAGAHSVIASYWPIADDNGQFFLSFYRHLRRFPNSPAAALQKAQIEMIGSSSWHSEPAYWASFFLVTRN